MFDAPENLAWIVLFLPLAAAAIIALFTRSNNKVSATLSIGAVVLSFLISLFFFSLLKETTVVKVPAVTWLSVGNLHVEFGLQIDRLSLLMLLVVTGVGSLIHFYSREYMKDDPSYSRFFACLSLFTFSMLGIVLSNNFFQMFVFWELVGLSSYLLIGFWYQKASAADACKKAFLTNRIGDFGFLLGIILLWVMAGSVQFDHLEQRIAANPGVLARLSCVVGLLIFCGAMGKSAQFPLHVWLPDAMEGPTPVSALIHAATMVAAGVYMLARSFFIYKATPLWPNALHFLNGISALDIIAWIGGITALLAALMAVQQNDIKRILAYSTLSQLGYMVMAVGCTAPSAGLPVSAMYHLTTHAFFKAMLFLGAGSVIYGLHHEQNIWKMGGLRDKMPVTFWTFLVGTLALCGVPPFSGFFSKDAILAVAYGHSPALFILGVVVAILTTFYMFRLVIVAFLGKAKSEAGGHAHESPWVMTLPLAALAVPSVLGGLFGIEAFLSPGSQAHGGGGFLAELFAPFNHSMLASLGGIGAVIFGLFLAYAFYWNAERDPLPLQFAAISRAMRNRFYFDEIYEMFINATQGALSVAAEAIDRWVIGGLFVKGLHGTTELVGRAMRLTQSGNLQTHAFLLVAGVAVILFFAFRP